MSKRVKGILEKEYKNRFEGIDQCIIVSIRGIDGVSNNEMRGALKDKDIQVTVVKNSLVRRALNDMGLENVDNLFAGPSAIATGGDSIVDLAKELVAWDKKLDNFIVKGAYLEGQTLDDKATLALSKMPNRVELQGMVVSLALAPGGRVVGAMNAPAATIAGCIKTLIENKEEAA